MSRHGLRVVYAGTPVFAVPALQELLQSHHEVLAVYTQPDRPSGRGRQLRFSPVKEVAQAAGVPVRQPEHFRSEAVRAELAALAADVMVVAAYGLILPQAVLDIPRFGCLNIHASLLPRWRGAAPIQRAIEAGDPETGVTIMQMAAGLDTGDMLLKKPLPIRAVDGAQAVHDQLAQLGAQALQAVLRQLEQGKPAPEPQDEVQACYAAKLNKSEAELDWQQSAAVLVRKIRAFDAWPTAYSLYQGQPLRFFSASLPDQDVVGLAPGSVVAECREGIDIAAGDGRVVRIHELQAAGGRRMPVADFVNARSLAGGRFVHSGRVEAGVGGPA